MFFTPFASGHKKTESELATVLSDRGDSEQALDEPFVHAVEPTFDAQHVGAEPVPVRVIHKPETHQPEPPAIAVTHTMQTTIPATASTLATTVITKFAESEMVAALRDEGVPQRHIDIAQRREALTRESLTTIMSSAEYGFLTPEGVARVNARLAKLAYYPPSSAGQVAGADIKEFLTAHGFALNQFEGILPVQVKDSHLVIGITESMDRNRATLLFPGVSHEYVVASQRTLQTIWRRNFADSAADAMALYHELVQARVEDDNAQTLLRRFVLSVMRHACYMGASDIGFTPSASESGGDVRLKVDGQGEIFTFLPKTVWDKVISHLVTQTGSQDKITKGPVDRRFEWLPGDHDEFREITSRYAFRIELLPRSESQPRHVTVVMRILDQQADTAELDQLEFDAETLRYLTQVTNLRTGLMLVVGPTGSGKTTTLYALLNTMDPVTRWLESIENPIEYQRGLWMQMQTMQATGDDSDGAASAEARSAGLLLKGMLRAAPDVILFGEIRKGDIAFELLDAANTGHLAFTTMHVNEAVMVFSRFKGFGVDMPTLGSLLRGVLAQRLVRTLCTHCAQPDERITTLDALSNLDYIDAMRARPMRPVGCPNCNGSGFRGRRMVYELLQISPAVRDLIEQDAPPSRIVAAGIKSDNTLYANSLKLVAKGLTTIEDARALSSFVTV